MEFYAPKLKYGNNGDCVAKTGIFYTTNELASLLDWKIKRVYKLLSEEKKPNTTQYRYA